MRGSFVDRTGLRVGALVAVRATRGSSVVVWEWRCDCGGVRHARAGDVLKAKAPTCGCRMTRPLAKPRKRTERDGRATWRSMLARCSNPRNRHYADYGGRGITVCDRWRGRGGFDRFLADMWPRPDGTTLDRKDNDGPYSPENCRWATATMQQRNSRHNRVGAVAVCLIREMRRRGASARALARAFGTVDTNIGLIVRGVTWDGAVSDLASGLHIAEGS